MQRVDVWGAMQAKSPEAWLQVLADDFVLRTPGEDDRDRLAFVERMTSFPGEVVSIACHDLRADAFGSAVIVTGVQHTVLPVLADPHRLYQMSRAAGEFGRRDADELLVGMVYEAIAANRARH